MTPFTLLSPSGGRPTRDQDVVLHHSRSQLILQTDGLLTLDDLSHSPTSSLLVQDDGNAVIGQPQAPLWASNTA
jgi:hypothetical protein